MAELLNVDKAIERILATLQLCAPEVLDLSDTLGRVLAEDVVSNVNLPAFANSSMDGYAVIAADTQTARQDAPVTLQVVMDIPAGKSPDKPIQPGQAARIMTGAPIPEGADAIVPVEQTDSHSFNQGDAALPETVTIFSALNPQANIRPIGENISIGQTVLTAGMVIRPAHMGMLAALGQSSVSVIRQPRVVILSSGDELLDIDEPLAPGKIRDVNSYTLAALVRENAGKAIRLPIASDTREAIRAMFEAALQQQPDMILSSAGVSVGAADFTRDVLSELGEVGFWRINLRPGKPLAFGQVQGIPFFGLPGNPVSAMVTFDVLVRPALLKLSGYTDSDTYMRVIAGETMRSDGRRTYMRVKLEQDNRGRLMAYSTGTQSSGALMSLVMADGLLIIPEDVKTVEAGTELTVKLLKPISLSGMGSL